MITKSKVLELFGVDGWAKLLKMSTEVEIAPEGETEDEMEKYKEVVTAEGLTIYAETWEVGGMVYLKEGEEYKPAPAGTHTIEGGIIVTDETGKITAYEDSGEVESEEMKALKAQVADLMAKLKGGEKTATEMQAQFEALKKESKEQKETIAKLVKVVDEVFSKDPNETKGKGAGKESEGFKVRGLFNK